MAAGKPVVVLKTPEALQSSTVSGLMPVLEGRSGSAEDQRAVRAIFTCADGSSLLPFVDTIAEFVALSIRLVGDTALRANMGAACKLYVERYARDEATYARTTCKHIVEIARDKAAASGGAMHSES
jgi:hypothetical protein